MKNEIQDYFVIFEAGYWNSKLSTIEFYDKCQHSRIPKNSVIQGMEPIRFKTQEQEKRRRLRLEEELGDIHETLSNWVVSNKIREILIKHPCLETQMVPAIVLDMNGCSHENYWVLHFPDRLDFWDRNASEISEEADPRFSCPADVASYAFDEKKMAERPLKSRLIFKMGNVQDPLVFVHTTLISEMQNAGVRGCIFIPAEQYQAGLHLGSSKRLDRKGVPYITL